MSRRAESVAGRRALARAGASMARTVRVALGERSYVIRVEAGAIGRTGRWMRTLGATGRVAIITNRKVAGLYGPTLQASLRRSLGRTIDIEVIATPDGERHKTLQTVEKLYDRLLAKGADRDMVIVALGGGVVGDMAGFVAATVLRGVRFVQVATTLLAQVDSSVGGKTGVNTRRGKNLVGAFHQPSLVVADPDTLATLSDRQYRAGLAEVVKYGIIMSPGLFSLLERRSAEVLERERCCMTDIVARCCRLKAKVVAEDESEVGLRRILNFGHTVGHAIEKVSGYRRFLHGEAVAMGMTVAMRLSARLGACDRSDAERVEVLLHRLGLPTVLPADVGADAIVAAIGYDKKIVGGKVRFILAEGIGRCRQEVMPPRAVARALV